MATPKTYTPEEIARNREAMLNRVRGGTREEVAVRENEGRNRYNAFLAERGIDPDTIGTARINRGRNDAGQTAGNYYSNALMTESDPVARDYALRQLRTQQTTIPDMAVPSLEAEYDAINAGNAIAGMHNQERIAARRLSLQNPMASASILNSLRNERIGMQGLGNSSERSLQYWMDRLAGAYDWRNSVLSSNGYAR